MLGAMTPDVDELPDLPDLASAVLDVVDLVPPGRVVAYGDVARVVGCGPRRVGAVMARWGGAVAWWRVLRADGSPPPGHEREALRRYRDEGTPLRADGRRVDLRHARWALHPVAVPDPGEPGPGSVGGT
jgi:alkylated DNA nucleotide flippase Atl1